MEEYLIVWIASFGLPHIRKFPSVVFFNYIYIYIYIYMHALISAHEMQYVSLLKVVGVWLHSSGTQTNLSLEEICR
jgi:hypothetical protein